MLLGHGLVQRADLPIPESLFGGAAAVVLVVSFLALAVLWTQPKLTKDRWRPLPGFLGPVLGSRWLEAACGAVGVALLALTVAAGLFGTRSPLDNFAPGFVFIVFWVGLVFASALLGNVFAALSPWRALGRVTGLVLGRMRGGRLVTHRDYPAWLGCWPAVAGLLGFTWIELASDWSERPQAIGVAALAYTIFTLAGQALFGVERWTRRGETFAVYFDLFSRIAAFERRDGVVGVRPPLGGLPRLETVPGIVALVVVMIGSVTFDGLSQGRLRSDATGAAAFEFPELLNTAGLLFGVALVGGFYAAGLAGVRSLDRNHSAAELRSAFVHSLIPIAMVYVAAHYLTYLFFEGQSIGYLVSDPLGEDWDLFGTAAATIDYGALSQNQAWYLQVGFVVTGHMAALVLAHDRALTLYPDSRHAVRSQYWMLAVMIGFTTLALWLLAAPQG